jgi:hypothetical protein
LHGRRWCGMHFVGALVRIALIERSRAFAVELALNSNCISLMNLRCKRDISRSFRSLPINISLVHGWSILLQTRCHVFFPAFPLILAKLRRSHRQDFWLSKERELTFRRHLSLSSIHSNPFSIFTHVSRPLKEPLS